MHDRSRFDITQVTSVVPSPQFQSVQDAAKGVVIAVAWVLLQACGSGGENDATTPAPPPVVVVKTTLSGTAATGAAMVGATVRVKCVAGNATATTSSNGAYTLELSGATLPCVVSATSSDNLTVLHSLVNPGGGNPQTININPLTELLVARVAGVAPASFFSSFDATNAVRVTAASIDSAITSVVATLRQGGVDFSAVGNPITALLIAATAAAPGNAYDQTLDALSARMLAATTTLAQLAAQVAAAVPSNAPTTAVAGLPPALLLQPASPTCAALRSGSYRLINPSETDPSWAESLMQINATTGVATFRDGSTGAITPTGNCTFSANGGNTRLAVSQGGVVMWTSFASNLNKQVLAIAFPEQPVALTDLAGTWNLLEFNNIQEQTPATPLWINSVLQADFAVNGQHQALLECQGLQACTPVTGPLGSARLSAQGGLDYVNADGSVARVFIYRPVSGHPMLVMVRPNKIFLVGSLRTAAQPRALGDTYGFYGLSMVPNGTTTATISDSDFRITAVDATTLSYTRQQVSNGLQDVLTANRPRPGLLHRAAGTGQLSSGQSVSLGEFLAMPLPGTGVIVSGGVTTASTRNQGNFGFSVTKF